MGRITEAAAPSASPQKKRQRKQEKEKGKARAPVQGGGQAGPSHVAATGNEEVVEEDGEWSWLSITDASPSRQPPVFTKDGSYFFSILGSSVKVYSVATGAIVSTLSSGAPGSHTDAITSAILNPHNAFQLITGSLDGHIKVWDFLDAVLLQTISVEQPIHFVVAHELFKDTVFVSAVRRKKNKATGKQGIDDGLVLRVSLLPTPETAGQDIQKSAEVTLVGKTRLARGLAVSPSGAWLVTVAGHKAYVASTASLKDGFTKFVSPEALTCLAFHPSEEYFATGDEKGTVRIWYCLSSDMTAQTVAGVEKRAPTTTLHWHAHAVSGLTFTPNGAYLLSGGEESVMVIWQLHTGKKEFVPRVGAPILNISVSRARQEEYLLGLADASFVFVNSASLKVARAFSRIKLDPSISTSASLPSSTPLAVHTPSQTIILPSSHASSLQSYSPSQMKLVAELEVSPSNRVSRRDEKALQPSAVERAVISSSGEWMATVDVREGDDAFRGEAYLKIWHWEKASGFWELNTRVDRPHGLSAVTAVSFSSEPTTLLVTTGRDGHIKTWRLKSINEKRSGNTERFWVLRSTFTFREETPSHAAWSPDGSLLAVSLGPYIAIYDAASSMLIQALTASESCSSVVSAYFLGASGRYVAAVGPRDVLLWDLISQRVVWHTRTVQPISHAVAHPFEDRLAVFEQLKAASHEAQTTRVSIFDANSSKPLTRVTLPFHLRSSVWYPPSSPDHQATSFCLVGVTEKYRVVLFGDEVLSITDPGASSNSLAGETSKQVNTLFQDIFGKSAFADVSVGPSTTLGVARDKRNNVADLLDVPAYLLPSVDTIFDTVMGSFLQPRPAEEPALQKQPEEIPEDVHMEVEEHTSARSFVEDEEIGMLIHFFRDVAVKGPYDPNAPFPVKGNAHFGAPPPIKRKKDKDRSKPRPPPTTPPQDSYPSPESTPSLTAVPPATAGKKRRKSQAS
ncbi:WD40 repeat-like protein [Peniophora sp. CONT]|nr:WD40 repeat-like protein [Peniophora sp. CONT]